MRFNRDARRLLPAVLVAIGGVVLAAVLAYAWGEQRELARQAVQSRQQLALHARALEQLVDRYRALPQVLALDPELRAAVARPVDAAERQRLNLRLEEANRTARASTLTLIDRHGTAVAASNWREPGSNVGEHYGFRPYVRQALDEGAGRFYGIGVTTGIPGYFLSELIRGDDGAPLGVVVIKIQLTELEHEWPRFDATVLVSDRHGVVFLASEDDWRYRTLRPLDPAVRGELDTTRQYGRQPLTPMVAENREGGDADTPLLRLAAPARGGQWLWTRVPLPESGWTLHLLRDVDAAMSAAARQAAIAASLLWLAAVLLALFIEQRRRMGAMRLRSRAELEALVQQHARELRSTRDGLLEAAQQADSGLSRQLDHLPQGVVVIDAALRVVAWNRRYIELFRFPSGFIRVGLPIEEVFRFNAQRGLLGSGPIEDAIARRLDHLRSGTPHMRESEKEDGTVLEIRGNPLPDGGFVTSYADITSYKNTARDLRSLADALELRVAERTADLEQARRDAVEANRYKTRFVAAAVHDLLQPLNAARMFLSSLRTRMQDPVHRELGGHVDAALAAQDAILASLLDISRLESGTQQVDVRDFALEPLFEALAREFGILAGARGLELRHVPTRLTVRSDEALLRRVLQNLLSNAVRYTTRGRILFGCRRVGDQVRIEVRDTGPGIPLARQREIFEEFRRLDDSDGTSGAGLGLAIVDRIARLLGHEVGLHSRPGHGSTFSVTLPRAAADAVIAPAPSLPAPRPVQELPLQGRTVWCIAEDPDACAGLRTLLERWGCRVPLAAGAAAARAHAPRDEAPDLVLLDRSTVDADSALFDTLAKHWRAMPPVVLLERERSVDTGVPARHDGVHVLTQPLRPPALRALVTQLLLRTA